MTIDPDYIPKLGEQLEGQGLQTIVEAVKRRQRNFPEEPLDITLTLVLLNIGARFDPLRCEGKEWKGFKKDLALKVGTDEDPTCPNGHAIIIERGITLGWVINRD